MTTLATMKAVIADEMMRDDLTSQIALKITEAIKFYQSKRFFFNETDGIEFQTLSTDTIPYLYDIDAVYVLIGNDWNLMSKISPEQWRILSTSTTTGQPVNWVYFQEEMRIYPDPDQEYTIKIMAHYRVQEPASDAEEGNRWMVEGEALIRHYAKGLLFRDVLYDVEKAAICFASSEAEYRNINSTTNKMNKTGFMAPTEF